MMITTNTRVLINRPPDTFPPTGGINLTRRLSALKCDSNLHTPVLGVHIAELKNQPLHCRLQKPYHAACIMGLSCLRHYITSSVARLRSSASASLVKRTRMSA